MKKINILVGVLLLLAAAGCKDPFEMELRSSDKTLLVVDGFLNKGMGRIEKFLAGGVEKGKVTAEEKDRTLGNLSGTTKLD